MSSRTLVVMRHAKAEQAGPSDYERPLAVRGKRDAVATGTWLAARGLVPDHAVVSGALRTRETWDHARAGAGAAWAGVEATYDRGLYAAGVDTAIDLLRLLDDAHECVVVLGHNPTVAYLAQLLDDGEGEVEASDELALGYPTSATTIFTWAGPWADLAPACARLVALHVGRG